MGRLEVPGAGAHRDQQGRVGTGQVQLSLVRAHGLEPEVPAQGAIEPGLLFGVDLDQAEGRDEFGQVPAAGRHDEQPAVGSQDAVKLLAVARCEHVEDEVGALVGQRQRPPHVAHGRTGSRVRPRRGPGRRP